MTKRTTIDSFAAEITKGLKEYSKLTEESLKGAVVEVSNEVRDKIKEGSPKKSGDYEKSWKVTKERETAHSIQTVVHSKNRYQLAHLLEFGHAKKNGGRTKAIPHIEPATRDISEKVLEKIKRDLSWRVDINKNINKYVIIFLKKLIKNIAFILCMC